MGSTPSISPNIGVNTASAQLRVELQNTFARLDGQLSRFPLVLDGSNGPVGNSGSAETDLFSTRIETGTLNLQGSVIDITASGSTAANGNNKTFKLYFGSTNVFSSGAIALNNKDWLFRGQIIRNGGASQFFWGEFIANGNSPVVDTGTITEDLTQNKVLKITGTGTSSADINVNSWKILFYN